MEWLSNDKGNLVSAIVLCVIALFSSFTLAVLVMGDKTNANSSFVLMQETHLLRSGIDRGQNFLRLNDSFTDVSSYDLGVRLFEIVSGRSLVTFGVKTKVFSGVSEQTNEIIAAKRGVKALVKAFKKRKRYVAFSSHDDNTVLKFRKYGERNVRKQTFAGFMYFTNTDTSVNDGPVYFGGRDELWGRIHSNTDILILRGSYPVFHDFVTSSGGILTQNGQSAPLSNRSVFKKGAEEYVPEIEYFPFATTIRQYGNHITGQDLLYARVEGVNHQIYSATINDLPADTLIVYDSYPPYGLVGDSLFSNIIVFRDTSWSNPISGTLNDGAIFAHSDLWIKGCFGGKQTWGCEGDMYLLGDITLANTPVGEAPDGYNETLDDYSGPINRTDIVGLVSERRIFMKYAYNSPETGGIYWENCGNSSNGDDGIFIYAAMAAMGQGDGWLDGHFSYEYQYPHPSTPHAYDWRNTDEDFMYPDLHLGKYPPVNSLHYWPWPANTNTGFTYPQSWQGMSWRSAGAPDYPWYNPVFPSTVMYFERGNVNIFGSIAQSRRGYIHRSGMDFNDSGYWDLDDPAHPMMGPGVLSNGYWKNYHFDRRFNTVPPPYYPEVNTRGGSSSLNGLILFKEPPTNDIF